MSGHLRGALLLQGGAGTKSKVLLLVDEKHELTEGCGVTICRNKPDGTPAAKWSGKIRAEAIVTASPSHGVVTPGMLLEVEVSCDVKHDKDEGDVIVVVVTVTKPPKLGDGQHCDRGGKIISVSDEVARVRRA